MSKVVPVDRKVMLRSVIYETEFDIGVVDLSCRSRLA